MKKLHTFGPWERPLANLLKDRLAQEGIVCLLRNDDLVSVMGEVPFIECYPELWVIDAETWPRAKLLLDGWLASASALTNWQCPACGEILEGQFNSCWNCGQERN